jgi:hypothetical protein
MSSNNNILINLSLTFSWIFMYILYLIGQLSIPLLPIHAFFVCLILYVNTLPDTTIKLWKHIDVNNNKMISKDIV